MARMTEDSAAALLAVAAAYDDRRPDRAQVIAWAEALSGLDFGASRDAVIAFYRDRRERRISPGDVRQLVTARRADAVDRSAWQARPPDPDDVAGYLDWVRDHRAAAADTPAPTRAIPARTGGPPAHVRELLVAARAACQQAQKEN